MPWNQPERDNLCLVWLNTSDTWWKETGDTSKKAKELCLGRSLVTTSAGSPLASVLKSSSSPPSFSDQDSSVR